MESTPTFDDSNAIEAGLEDEPKRYSVVLQVEMEGHSPEGAAWSVVEMADGWTYEVTDIETGKLFFVHMDHGVPRVVAAQIWPQGGPDNTEPPRTPSYDSEGNLT